jgi:hypothetical protein
MAEQYKSMSPEDVREQKMRDNMGKAAEKARENSLGKADKPAPAPAPTPAPAPAPAPATTSKKMAKGGTASSRADGCCVKGKTRGKMM